MQISRALCEAREILKFHYLEKYEKNTHPLYCASAPKSAFGDEEAWVWRGAVERFWRQGDAG